MKNVLKTTLSALAVVTMTAISASAATLTGTFEIDIRNFTDPGVTETNSAATPENFGLQTSDAVISYTGDIDFGIGAGNSDMTYIWDFLTSAGGTVTTDAATETFLKGTLLSQGNFVTTTFFAITGMFDTMVEGLITHDDGITLVASNQTGGISAPPTVENETAFTADAGTFTLFYAAANGNPSILNVQTTAVPLPAGGLLLLSALGGVAVLRRRKTV